MGHCPFFFPEARPQPGRGLHNPVSGAHGCQDLGVQKSGLTPMASPVLQGGEPSPQQSSPGGNCPRG